VDLAIFGLHLSGISSLLGAMNLGLNVFLTYLRYSTSFQLKVNVTLVAINQNICLKTTLKKIIIMVRITMEKRITLKKKGSP
jgi:heme/copper-type cytochrome/quinol oxidase subunit 1